MNKEGLEENELRKFLHNTVDVMTFEQLRSVAQSIGLIDPDPIPLPTLKPGDKVRHKDFPHRGEGIVYAIKGNKANVYFAKTEVGQGIRAYYRLDKLELVEVQADVR
ncbi:hypothetical protein BK138_16205 [Paenibacillus rhizosphaerae]|uniref:Uncharacterized protein n=1 Tax=Paenibacillus rhizosphaerae TaxID=297318 RepID=A0A1R1ESD8_9BACL|nr:hypothetical protein [Paenibacillus rhizosphaerae]OMF54698.1 hypothetical protein BK138_16205 [Paenibacillus rhizosphaerae]